MSNYLKKIEKKGKSVEEALELALKELKVSADEVDYQIIEEPSKGFLGLGAKEATISVEIKDEVAYDAKMFLGEIFKAMDLDVNIQTERDDNLMKIDISGDNMGIIIGKRGDTLDSLQYLTSLVANRDKGKDGYTKISLDTENYREKRLESLKALSERLADKVAKSGKKYTLEPMNPYERRIIHANLQDNESVTTFSVGDDPYRKVVIAPKFEKRRAPYRSNSAPKPRTQPQAQPKKPLPPIEDDLPRTYAGGGRAEINKASSFEEYLSEKKSL